MNSCIYRKDEFVILQSSRGYVVVNTKGNYCNHSHFNFSLQAAKDCIRFVQKKIVPRKSNYMLVACRRLTLDKDYMSTLDGSMDNKKNKYINFDSLMRRDSHKRRYAVIR